MCGIAGYFDQREHRAIPEPVLRAMTDVIAHRGPDGSGVFRAPGVGLGHRRLSIIDLAGGVQPMPSEDGKVQIVFNGEIYNFREVRRDLQALGHVFRRDSDTEVIIAAWRAWGEACVDRLRGMFAFAIWDETVRTLFLARDRLGVKPLYYADLGDGRFIFGSELKALLMWPGLPRAIDPRAIEDYFAYGYVPDDKCLLSAVKKLPAGHTLTLRWGETGARPRRYWDVAFDGRVKGTPEALAEELTARMREAVALRLVADVPVGAFLSGGVDSSAVVALMAGLIDTPVNSCSIGFDDPAYDETGHAEAIAKRYATHHRARTVTTDDYDLIDTLVRAFDEPFADASALPTYRVSELARETVTVALSGDGADEAMAGYRRYRLYMNEEKVRGAFSPGLRESVFGRLGRAWPKLDWAPRMFRAKSTFEAIAMDSAEAYFHAVSATPDSIRSRLFSDTLKRAIGGYWAGSLYADTMRAAPADDMLGRAQYADLMIWLPGDILTKVDRTSMAVSLEAREPLLDHELVGWMAGLPSDLRLRGGEGKWLMKKAMEPYLPKDILYRRKMGFSVPIDRWFRGALADRVAALANGSNVAGSGWFDMNYFAACAAAHRSGRADHSRLLWQMLMLEGSLAALAATPAAALAA
ncbi:MAG: amidotransferase 1, exosortase A system-associated [Sphingomonadaceae bacterium]|nr:amidotransferase 1, exosortase A system-associated [Sphingomonadaceae bacterium]